MECLYALFVCGCSVWNGRECAVVVREYSLPAWNAEDVCPFVVIDGVLGFSATIGTYKTLTKGAVLSPIFGMGIFPSGAVSAAPSDA